MRSLSHKYGINILYKNFFKLNCIAVWFALFYLTRSKKVFVDKITKNDQRVGTVRFAYTKNSRKTVKKSNVQIMVQASSRKNGALRTQPADKFCALT